MAERGFMANKSRSAEVDENDPILQGADLVQSGEKIDSRISPEEQQGNEDTHTKSNIHLGGRDDEGVSTGPEDDETSFEGQSLDAINPGGKAYPIPDGGTIGPSENEFVPVVAKSIEEESFQSSGRATPEVQIEEVDNNQPNTRQLEGVSSPNTTGITPLSNALNELENALLPEDDEDQTEDDDNPPEDENNPPTTGPVDLGATDEDTPRVFSLNDLLSSASDPDGDELTVGDVSINPDFGVIIDNGDGTYTFEPAPDFNGDDLIITYTISDGTTTIPGTAIIDVLPVNDPPASADSEAIVDEDTSYTFGADDFAFSDIDGDSLDHLTIIDLPLNGTLLFNGNPVNPGDNIPASEFGLLVFVPDANENGDDYATFNFTVNDGTDDSGQYTFSIDVTPVNDLPMSADDGATIDEDTSYTFGADDFAFSDIDGDSFSHITIVNLPLNGTLLFNGNPVNPGDTISSADLGLLVFTPDENENGDDYATFDFTVNDGTDDSGQYTFSIDVTPVNDLPVSADNEITIDEDTSHGFSLADFEFNDVDGDSIDHITITELPANGELTLFGNPVSPGDDIAAGDIVNLLFTPDMHASGNNYGDFKFTVNDGTVDSEEYDFSINVTAVADTPDVTVIGEIEGTSGLYDISAGGIVTISATYYAAIADVALFENAHGYYVADSDGNPIGGAIIQDNVKEGGNFDISFDTADYPGGVTLGFFVVPDGDTRNLALQDGDPVTFEFIDGIWTPFVDGVALNGAPNFSPYFGPDESLPAFFSNPALNADNYDHLTDNPTLGNQNWEDIVNGGDGDYTDVNVQINVTLQTFSEFNAQGLEGTLIELPDIVTSLTDTDGSEFLTVTISNIPDGVILSDGQGNEFTATGTDNDVDITGWNLTELKVFSPEGQDDFVLQVTSTATETSNNDQASVTRNINVDILHAPETSVVDLGSTPEDTGITFSAADLLINATDEDGDALSVSNVAIDPAFGTIIDNGDNTYTFNPALDFNGNDLPVTYEITDGLVTVGGIAVIDVEAVNDAPLTQNASISMIEDINYIFDEDNTVPFSIGDFAFDDVDGDALDHITIVNLPDEGRLLLNGNPVEAGDDILADEINQLVFVPDPDENGEDYASFDFTVNDGEMDSEVKTVTIDVTPVNDAPTSTDQEITTDEDTVYVFSESDFVFNDIDTANMDHITIIDLPENGVLSFDGIEVLEGQEIPTSDIGLLTYTPDENENGDDYAMFNFTVNDGELDSDPQTITINVSDINDGPVAINDTSTGDEDTQQSGNVLSNDDDVDGTVSVRDVGTFNTDHGSIAIDAAGNYTYTPDVDYHGPDSFDYTIIDDDGAEATATLNLTVEDVNDAPTAIDDSSTGDEDTQQSGNVLGNDNDVDGTISVKDIGTFTTDHGSITIDAAGNYTYTPDVDYYGPDSFDYTIIDDDGAEATATLNLTVEDVNDGPTSAGNEITIDEDTEYTFQPSDYHFDDVDGDGLDHITITELSSSGSLRLNGVAVEQGDEIVAADIGNLTFTPDENASGDDYGNFKFTVSDGTANSAEYSFIINVDPVADTPSVGAREEILGAHGLYDISEGGEITIDVSYHSVEAGYDNTHGYYIANCDGEPIAGVILQDDVKEQGQTTVTFNTDAYPDGVTLGFFIIADGHNQNAGLSDGDVVTFENISGVWTPYLDGEPLQGAQSEPAYFSDQSLNTDGYDHFEDSGAQGNQNWEDLIYGGDLDHSDVNTDVRVYIKKFADVSVQGDDGTLIELPNLSSELTDVDGSEDLTVILSSIPDGATLSDSHGNTFMADTDNNSVDITSWNMTGLTIFPPAGSGSFNLQLQAMSTESANADTATLTRNITVNIVDIEALHDQAPAVPFGYDETYGSDGSDQIYGDDNGNYIDGGDGKDELYGQGGSDILVGGSGKDELSGGDGHDKLYGGTGNDIIQGNDGDDTLYGGSGKDTLEGNDGDDTLVGDAGNDILKGGAGHDNLRGGTGNDVIEGGSGNDLIYGGADNDTLFGNDGHDIAMFAVGEGNDNFDGGAGVAWTDSIELTGFAGLDHEVGWTLVLDSGVVQSTDDEAGEMILSQDSDGKIIFDDGGTITFENVEKISW